MLYFTLINFLEDIANQDNELLDPFGLVDGKKIFVSYYYYY